MDYEGALNENVLIHFLIQSALDQQHCSGLTFHPGCARLMPTDHMAHFYRHHEQSRTQPVLQTSAFPLQSMQAVTALTGPKKKA